MNSNSKKEINWNKQIQKLSKFISTKGFEVRITDDIKDKISIVDFEEKVIRIYSNHCDEYKFYFLLHEFGHVVNYENKRLFNLTTGYGQRYFTRNSISNKVSVLDEELEAWKTGQNIAKQFKLKIRLRNFVQLKSACVASYAKYFFKGK